MLAHLVLDIGRALYVGELDSVPPHRAAVAALLVGLERDFELVIDGVTTTHRATIVPALTEHALEFHVSQVAVLYFEPGTQLADVPLDPCALTSLIHPAVERGNLAGWHALLEALKLPVAEPTIDLRIATVAALLRESPDESIAAQQLAAAADLSTSRLEHLFKQQLGIPLRAYRGWYRFRFAAAQLLAGATLTDAAHAAGFHDSAHFTHAFRQTFGLPPSFIFSNPELVGHTITEAAMPSPTS